MAKTRSAKNNSVVSATEIPQERVSKAVEQLNKFVSKKAEEEQENGNDLLGGDIEDVDQNVSLIAVNTTSFTGSTKQLKLKLVDVENSLYKPWKKESVTALKDFKALLILKDQDLDKITEDELFDALNEDDISVDEVISVKALKTTYKAFEARRSFVQQFSLILADDSVVTTLPKLLGGKAFDKVETTPIGIKTQSSSKKQFSKETLINSIKRVYLHKLPIKLPRGTTLNAHLGQLNWFDEKDLVKNIESVSKFLIDNYKIRSIFIKTNKSPVLPLYYNTKVVEELLAAKKDETKSAITNDKVTIDGVEVELSNFEKSLLEIANPKDLSSIFSKNIKDAKRSRDDEETIEETQPKKAKK
ncbi:proteasome-interacting protein Cic1p [Monosporozyma unispora]|nr:hypothetical protein C6P44_005144 [Kazachstania unispora]